MNGPRPGQLAQLACILEATARKPGNVHRFADFEDCSYLDFLLSAAAIAGPLDRARDRPLGATVLEAIEATRALVASNTNLGIVLLLTPLAMLGDDDGPEAVSASLQRTTVDDARQVYQAIRLAQPGGLGRVEDQDIRDEPTVTLLEAMRQAAGRDAIARQYATGFADVYRGLGVLRAHLEAGSPLETAVIATHLSLMKTCPDTLIARKLGPDAAIEAAKRAGAVLEAGWPNGAWGDLRALDAWLRASGNARNPGATADLVTAVLFLALRDGTIRLPLSRFADHQASAS